jgi:hypothetical protein
MHVQIFVLSFAIAASGLVPLACLAQQPTGAATLETSASVDDSKAKTAGTVRPAGTLVRPQDGVQHPDLDKAWTEYDAAVAKVTESIKAIIAKQFDAATEKGDLDAAEKWQIALQAFDENGQLPSESGTRAVASAAATELKAAKDSLEEAYGTVVKALTREKKIAEAKAVRSEAKAITNPAVGDPTRPVMAEIPREEDSNAKAEGSSVFLSDLPEQEVFVGFGSFGKNGDLGYGGGRGEPPRQITVRGKAVRKGLSMCPPSSGASTVTYRVPKGYTHLVATVAINDFAAHEQKAPVFFKVVAGRKLIWKSQPIIGAGRMAECSVALRDADSVTLMVECPGDHFCAHAVWCDPSFVAK